MNSDPLENNAGRSAKILVVDDTLANLELLTTMLRVGGYDVVSADSGHQALLAVQQELPDLILLDINMPGMSGYEVCERLKSENNHRIKGIPIIFVSALSDQLDKVKAFAIGGIDYLTKPLEAGELYARVETHLEVHRLQTDLEEANSRLIRANNRMRRDLKAAANIQQTFLPREMPSVPGYDFAWVYQPCDELAGDGLNVIPLGDGKIGLFILDVSGHGVASALLSVAMSRLLSRPSEASSILTGDQDDAGRRTISTPAEVAGRLNDLFPFDTATGQFATLLYGILDSTTGDFNYVCAGHPGPLYLATDAEPVLLAEPDFPIGLAEGDYLEQSIRLAPGDRLYLYSDGVTEATDVAKRQFGEARFTEMVRTGRGASLQDNVHALLETLARWQGAGKYQDDISVLAIEASRCNA